MKLSKLLIPIGLLAAAGCAGSTDKPMQFLPPHLTITDAGLSSVIDPMTATETVDPYGIRTVTVPLKLRGDGDVNVDYRFTFFGDDNRTPQDDNPKWESAVLHPGVTKSLVGTSPKSGSVDYTLEVRPAQQ